MNIFNLHDLIRVCTIHYPTAVRRSQIIPKTSTNITQYLYSDDWLERFSRNAQAMNWIEVKKNNSHVE